MKNFPRLETEAFVAYIADNSPLGIHRAGYNGVASLIPKHSGNNLFVPMYAGLNYETISLAGLPPYSGPARVNFEPRCEPMRIEAADEKQVVLAQPETSHSHVSARIVFSVEEPCYIHQHIELTFHRRFCAPDEKNTFRSLWASYIHAPPDRHIYLKPDIDSAADLEGWIGVTKADHMAETEICTLPSGRELSVAEHLEAMTACGDATAAGLSRPAPSHSVFGPLSFYYGFCHDDQMFLMMFAQPDGFRLFYSPCGAGKEPAWNPAWDYLLHLDDAEIGQVYTWDVCLAVKPFAGRADALAEVRRHRARF